jgi:hypothetical protein
MKLTLDWNCVIEVEQNGPQSTCVLQLIESHRAGRCEVALLAASASENSRSKRFPGNAGIFQERVSALGWTDLPIVRMPGVMGLSYWGFCYYVEDGEKYEQEVEALWKAIAPNVARDWRVYLPAGKEPSDDAIQSEELSKWRNTWCDVIFAYSHIHERRDIFVTNNTSDFQRNAKKLAELGMKHICAPKETLGLLDVLAAR